MLRLGVGIARYRAQQVTPAVLNWILDLGFWQDRLVWIDTETWKDF